MNTAGERVMTEQQTATKAQTIQCQHPEAVGVRWGDPISAEDETRLQVILRQWDNEHDHGDRRSPWDGVRLTGAHVYWLVMRTLMGGAETPEAIAVARERLHSVGRDDILFAPGEPLERTSRRELLAPLTQGPTYYDLDLSGLHLEGANLAGAHLEGAILAQAHLEGAILSAAHLQGASLLLARLDGAVLFYADLQGTELNQTVLEGAILSGAGLDKGTYLLLTRVNKAFLGMGSFREADLTLIDWSQAPVLGDELYARQPRNFVGEPKKPSERINDYQAAAQVYQALAGALSAQGVSEAAASYAYRAQLMQRHLLWRQRHLGQWLFSAALDALAGYGYKPGRSLAWYLTTIVGFAIGYWLLGPAAGHPFAPDGALIFSLTSFHGRGFFPGGLDLENWITRLAAVEAVIGLFIEISFIATFTQRYFGVR